MKHIFDVDIAKIYGVNAAILLENLGYWIKENEANERNFFDGNYWTYNSRRAYRELFPYMSERQINTAFQKLIDDGLVMTGNYNKLAYDRTLWYALTQKGKCILHFDIMDNDNLQNGNGQNVTPIPNINTAFETTNVKADIENIIARLNERAGARYRTTTGKTQQLIKARLNEGFTVDDFYSVIEKKCAEWRGTEWEKFLRPETLFGTKFESYLNAPAAKRRGANGVQLARERTHDLDDIL